MVYIAEKKKKKVREWRGKTKTTSFWSPHGERKRVFINEDTTKIKDRGLAVERCMKET